MAEQTKTNVPAWLAVLLSLIVGTGAGLGGANLADDSQAVDGLTDQVSDLKNEIVELQDVKSEPVTVADPKVIAENARLTNQVKDLEQDLSDIRESGAGFYGNINPLFGGDYPGIIQRALSDIEDEFNEVDTCGNSTYDDDEMDIEDYDNDVDVDPQPNGALEVTFDDVEVDYDNECTRVFDSVQVTYERDGDIDVDFNQVTS